MLDVFFLQFGLFGHVFSEPVQPVGDIQAMW